MPLPRRFPSTPFPAPEGAGKGVEFVRFKKIYVFYDPTPKGVGYVLISYFIYFCNP